MAATTLPKRKRIIIALDQDNFYVAVERILNPELVGKCVGVTQKSLLATTSYEARAVGISKLMSIRQAKAMCSELILVDGEDLGKYRMYSKKVARVVNGILGVGGEKDGMEVMGVEKLGLDEIFCDVSTLIYNHLDNHLVPLLQNTTSSASPLAPDRKIWFQLPNRKASEDVKGIPEGFWYTLEGFSGHVYPSEGLRGTPFASCFTSSSSASSSSASSIHKLSQKITSYSPSYFRSNLPLLPLLLASHLTNFIRKQLARITGLSSSGGIAHSKMLAKLIGNENKPDGQTCFLEGGDLDGYRETNEEKAGNGAEHGLEDGMDRFVREYVDGMDVGKINGFGHKTIIKIKEFLASQNQTFDVQSSTTIHQPDPDPNQTLTISDLRHQITLPQLSTLFGSRLGLRLHQLLHAIDDEPIHPSPEYPKQISVEDSFALDMKRTWEVIGREMLELTILLLERLQDELLVSGTEAAAAVPTAMMMTTGKHDSSPLSMKQWIRYPSQFRLQVRREWEAPRGRDSKSTALPAFIFDLRKPLMERAEMLHKRVGLGLLRDLMGIGKAEKESDLRGKVFVVYVINVAVSHLETEPPPPSLLDAWAKTDYLTATAALSTPPRTRGEIDPTSPSPLRLIGSTKSIAAVTNEGWTESGDDYQFDEDDDEDDLMDQDNEDLSDNRAICETCGQKIFAFAMVAHARFHEMPE